MPKQERWEYDADDAQDRHRGIDPLEDNVPARLADARLKAAFGRVVSGPSLPSVPTGEYVWFKTDGSGHLLDILSGVSA